MRRWSWMCVLLAMGCTSPKSSGLAGDYVAWMFLGGKPQAADGSDGTTYRLTLKGDGTYKMRVDSNLMVTIHSIEEGSYRQTGDVLVLRGEAKTESDDGYKKSSGTDFQSRRFRIEHGDLILDDQLGPMVFRKEGRGAPPVPKQLELGKSDPAATALLQRLSKTYAAMKSFHANGTLKSNGAGFAARDAKFELVFRRPSSFRYEAFSYENGKQLAHTEVTWSGASTCRLLSDEYGVVEDRPLGNVLSIESVAFGDSAYFLPSLLLPTEVGSGEDLGVDREVTLMPDETIRGKKCAVIRLRSKDNSITKLWIDRPSGTIVRSFNDITDQTMDLDSVVNGPIRDEDFRPQAKAGANGH